MSAPYARELRDYQLLSLNDISVPVVERIRMTDSSEQRGLTSGNEES